MSRSKQHRSLCSLLLGLALFGCLGMTGCQVDMGGQTLPSQDYLTDDVQYYAPGPEFKLAREAAAQKAYNQEMAARKSQP